MPGLHGTGTHELLPLLQGSLAVLYLLFTYCIVSLENKGVIAGTVNGLTVPFDNLAHAIGGNRVEDHVAQPLGIGEKLAVLRHGRHQPVGGGAGAGLILRRLAPLSAKVAPILTSSVTDRCRMADSRPCEWL